MPKKTTYTAEDFKLATTKAAAMLFVGATKKEATNAAILSLIDKRGYVDGILVKKYELIPAGDTQPGEEASESGLVGEYIYHLNNPSLQPLKEDIIEEALELVAEWKEEIGSFEELFASKQLLIKEEGGAESLFEGWGIPPFPEAVDTLKREMAA